MSAPPKRRPTAPLTIAGIALLAWIAPGWLPPAAADQGLTSWDVARLREVTDVAISPDGKTIAYLLQVPRNPLKEENGRAWRELHVVGLEGSSRPFASGKVRVGDLAWTPDGKEISFLATRGNDEYDALWSIPLAGGEARRILALESDVDAFSWCADGRRLAVVAREPEATKRREMRDKGFDQEVFEEDWRPIRLWLATIDEAGQAGEPQAVDVEGSVREVAWSPTCDRLVLQVTPTPAVDDEYMEKRVRVIDPSGEVVARIDNPGKLDEVVWSPDGRHLALIAGVDRHDPSAGRLMVVPAGGGALRDLLPGLLGHVRGVAWRDAQRLVFLSHEGVGTRIGEVDLEGREKTLLRTDALPIEDMSLAPTGALGLRATAPSHPAEVFYLAPGGEKARRLTDGNPWLAEVRLAPQEVVRYRARDGLELEGILIRPLDEEPGRRYPLILVVHGGPEGHYRNGWQTRYSRPGQVAAARGFAVFHQNYRASTGRGVEFSMLDHGDMAGKEFDDLVDGIDHLVAAGLADPKRVGITGGSYGGYATAWGATYYSERFAAAVMFAGISDLISKNGTSDIPNELYLVHERQRPWEDYQHFLERSPIYYVEKARTPILILHGTDDARVHYSQGLEFFRFLKILGQTPVRLVLYPGEKHGNRRAASRLDYSLRQMRWLEHYLKGPGGEPPPWEIDYEAPAPGGK